MMSCSSYLFLTYRMSRREGPQRTTRRGPLTSSTNLLTDATHATVEKVLMCGYYNLLPRLLPQPEPQVQTSPDPAAAASVSAKIVGSAGVADSPSGSSSQQQPHSRSRQQQQVPAGSGRYQQEHGPTPLSSKYQ